MKIRYTLLKSLPLIVIMCLASEAIAQKAGGILRRANDENPPSASLHEEGSNIVAKRGYEEVERQVKLLNIKFF
jgi:hypothetical protein